MAENTLLTVAEIADMVRVDQTTVRRWIKNGALDAVSLPHVGKRCAYRVRRATIEALLNQPAHAPVPVPVHTITHKHNHA